jgi:hypothetical protein
MDWIDCKLTIMGNKDNLQLFEGKARGSIQQYVGDTDWQEVLSFHCLYPVPETLTATYYSEKSYDWEKKHWGCKHGAKHSKIEKKSDESLIYSFLVSGVPMKWLMKVSRDYPDLIFYLDLEDGRGIVVEGGVVFEQSGDI